MKSDNIILVSDRIASDLVTRNAADELMDFVKANRSKTVILDFRNVEFASRSFTHEYLIIKKRLGKKLIERNMSSAVNKMFKAVSTQRGSAVPQSTSSSITYLSFSSKSL
jgi:hypothetical protein